MANQTTQLTQNQRQQNLKTMLIRAIPSLQGVASSAINPERIVRIALSASSRRPELLNCTPNSILLALLQAAQMGLEPETNHQHAYLIPYFNGKTKQMEAQFQESYRGLMLLAKRSGDVASSRARVVYANEPFLVREGLEPTIDHTPLWDEDSRGDMVCVYAVAVMRDGTKEFEVMTRRQIDAIRGRSRAANSGPWVTDYEQMAKKTVLRRLLRRLPIENEKLADALARRDEDESNATAMGEVIPMGEVTTGVEDSQQQHQTRADELAGELTQKKRGRAPKPAAAELPEKAASAPTPIDVDHPADAALKSPARAEASSKPTPQQRTMDWGGMPEPMTDEERRLIEMAERED